MSLANYMHSYLTNSLTSFLGWTVEAGSYDFAVSDTLETYGVATEAEATDTTKLHKLAKYKIWEQVVNATTGDYNFSADNASYSRAQVNEMAKENLKNCFREALPYLEENVIAVGNLTTEEDPYIYLDDCIHS